MSSGFSGTASGALQDVERAVTVIMAAVVALTFPFAFGNVLNLALRLGVAGDAVQAKADGFTIFRGGAIEIVDELHENFLRRPYSRRPHGDCSPIVCSLPGRRS